jgi:hypothetical protein
MGGPRDGKYYILPAVDPKILVGVDGVGNPWVPLVTDGNNNVFTVRKLENGDYTLILEDGVPRQYIQDHDGKLVGNEQSPASAWTIQGSDCGPYTIEVPSSIRPTKGWVLKSEKPKSPIALNFIEVTLPEQLWNFVPKLGLLSK